MVIYEHLSTYYYVFVTAITPMIVSSLIVEALSHLGWKAAMEEEMQALRTNGT